MIEAIIVGAFTLSAVFVTLFWQWQIERQRTARTRTGMLKATIVELRHNASVCLDRQLLPDDAPILRLTTDTWTACRFDLAQFLPDDAYETLVFTYEDEIPRLQLSFDRGDAASSILLATIFSEELKKAMLTLLSLPEASSFRDRFNVRLYEKSIIDEDFIDDGTSTPIVGVPNSDGSTHFEFDKTVSSTTPE